MKNSVEKIWTDFSYRIRSYILKRISNRSDAEDILQDVFLKIHSKIDSLKDETKIISWIYSITRNTITDYYRKPKIKTSEIGEMDLSDELNEQYPVQKAPEGYFITYTDDEDKGDVEKEIAGGLKEMVESLPKKYSQALQLVELNGLSQIELACKLGISVSGAKSRVQRGRTMLKDMLMRCCHFEFDKYGTIISVRPNTCCCCR